MYRLWILANWSRVQNLAEILAISLVWRAQRAMQRGIRILGSFRRRNPTDRYARQKP